jgi:hypothetical protein
LIGASVPKPLGFSLAYKNLSIDNSKKVFIKVALEDIAPYSALVETIN